MFSSVDLFVCLQATFREETENRIFMKFLVYGKHDMRNNPEHNGDVKFNP